MDEILHSLFPPEYLEAQGIKSFDDLSSEEKGTYLDMARMQETGQLTLEAIKKHVSTMRQSVEYELAKLPEGDKRNTFYKARLMNYILFENVFDRPTRAKEQIARYAQRRKV